MKALSLLIALSFSAAGFAQIPNAADAAKAAAAQAQTAGAKAQEAGAKANEAGAKAQAAGAKAQETAGGKMAAAKGMLVNINTASKEDLQKIPGIGPDKAQAIIANRPYGKVEELTKVKGIKGAVLAKIKPYVTTN